MRSCMAAVLLMLILIQPVALRAQTPDVAALRAQIEQLKADYDKRIKDLETQLEEVETKMLQLAPDAQPIAAVVPVAPTSAGALNPAISVVGNFVARADNQKIFLSDGDRIDNRMNLREAEIDMRVPVDPYADAVLIMSLESEKPNEFSASIEEGYVNIKKLPFMPTPLGMKFQVGRFRPSFGKFNTLHTHDLPTTMRSLATEEFLGEEGFVSQGLSTEFFVPTPWDENSSLNAKLQVLTGGAIAASPDHHNRLAYVGNLRWFKTIGGSHNADVAWSTYVHPAKDSIPAVKLHAVDFMYRWKPFRQGQWKSYLLGGEVMFTDRNVEANRRPYGTSIFTQVQLDRRKYAGVRWDYTTGLVDPTILRRSLTPYFSYYFSEFLRLRLNYETRWSSLATENRRRSAFIELNWIFGAHPPEPFWVNR